MSRPIIISLKGRRADRDTYRWAPSLKPIASRVHHAPPRLRRRHLASLLATATAS